MAKYKPKMERIVIVSDIHVPFHDGSAVNAVLSLISDVKPSEVVLNGDIMDCYTVSKYSKDPSRGLSLVDELSATADLLTFVRKAAGNAPITYIEGNHEIRMRAYINGNAPALSSLDDIRLDKLLNLEERGIEYIKARNRGAFKRYGNVIVGHFDRVVKDSAGTAKVLVNDHMASIVQGHTHRLGVYHKSTIGGDYVGVEGGCLCQLNPEYLDTANWQQGITILSREVGTTEWSIESVPVVGGRVMYNGMCYDGR